MNPTPISTLALSLELLKQPSVTPDDSVCLEILENHLSQIGFDCEFMPFAQTNNLWATKGQGAPVLCFAGHTDVVPVGDESAWRYPPFSPTVAYGYLYGRGAADMKTAICAFVVATQRFVAKHPNHKGTIAYLITGDEEGVAVDGTVQVVKALQQRGQAIDYCIVGEPSCTAVLGDTIKNGRRGSLNAKLTVTGKQGHVAYPHLAANPIHYASCALAKLASEKWDNGNAYFPATSLQISNVNSGTGATNVIPETLTALFNFRFSTQTCADELKARTHQIFDACFVDARASYEIDWTLSGEPFLTKEGTLVKACQSAIDDVCGIKTHLSTSGGTSDGRFIAPMGAEVVELGVINATIHQINECVLVEDLEKLTAIYERILEQLLA